MSDTPPLPVPLNPDATTQQQSPPVQPSVQPAPDPSNLPPRDVQSPIPAVNPIQERHSAIGRTILHFAHALEGKQINYEPDENGEVREVVSPRKPGGFFRDLLLSSIAGAAAGAYAPPGSGALAGAALGAQAGLGTLQQQQQRRKDAAQSDANQQQRDEQKTFQAAQVAAHTINGIQFHHFGNLHNDRQIQSFNTSNGLVMDHILDQGGSLAPIVSNGQNINGKTGNGKALAQMFNADPQKVMQAGDGMHRLLFSKIDTTDLHNVNGRWVDAKGKDVDLDDRTSYSLVDVPVSLFGKSIPLTAGTINDVTGHQLVKASSPDKTFSTTLGNMFALGLKNIEDLNKARQQLYTPPKKDEVMSRRARLDQIRNDPDATAEDQHWAAVQEPMIVSMENQAKQEEDAKAQREVGKAVDTARGTAPIEVGKAVDIERGKAPIEAKLAGQKKAAELRAEANAPGSGPQGQDIFGSQLGGPGIDRKEFNKRYDSFSKDYIQPLNRLKKTDVELNRIMASPTMTGAQKVTALLGAVGISGDPLQGKGFRINQAIVAEHAGARNIWETATQKANQLIGTGGPITEKQVRDYESIARDVVHDAHVAAANEAHRQGLPVDFLQKGSGKMIDPETAKLFLDIAGGDKDAARKAAQASGWRF